MRKGVAAVITLGFVIAVFLPVSPQFRGDHGDEFPFSWYPMFSRPRPALEKAHYVLGLGENGERYIIHAKYYVKGGMNQARRQLDRLVRTRRTAQETCDRAARNLVRRQRQAEVVELRVVRGFYDMEKYFSRRETLPEKEEVLARCFIERATEEGDVQ